MDPQIRYCTTTNGISIAYWTMGAGPPLVMTEPFGFSHIQLELEDAEVRKWYDRLALNHTIVRWDPPANGLSQRGLSREQLLATGINDDLAAVIAALSLDRFDLFGMGASGFSACEFAASNPDRVRKLILWAVPPDGRDWGSDEAKAVLSMRESDWKTFTETFAHTTLGWSNAERAREWARFMRRAMTAEDFLLVTRTPPPNLPDPADVLARIGAPTLVLYPRVGGRVLSNAAAQRLTASIANAQLVLVPVERGMMVPSNEDGLRAIEEFLSDGRELVSPEPAAATADPTGTAIILFADIVDSTRITERIGDAAFRERARTLDERLRAVIRAAAGTPVEGKLLGDGVLAVFTSARQAIDAALRCAASGADLDLQLHLGIHAGDVIREGDNVFGGAVNIASRISGLSAPDEVLVSATVRDLARTSAGVTFEDRGEHALKGIDDPQRVFAVRSPVPGEGAGG